jgi:hypothetical protein
MPTLRFASFTTCDFPQIDATPTLILSRLKQIRLLDVGIMKTAMHRLFVACPVSGDQWIQHS